MCCDSIYTIEVLKWDKHKHNKDIQIIIIMIITIIGLFHLIHAPLLVLFPFIVKNFTTDVFYIIYFFSIMFFYTFLDGECPISYICKVMMDKKYIAGTDVAYYPEMERLLPNKKIIDYYFGTMTILYIATLVFVIFRINIFSYVFIFVFTLLLNYFLFVRNYFSIKKQFYFPLLQEITKYTLFLTICFLLNLSHLKSSSV